MKHLLNTLLALVAFFSTYVTCGSFDSFEGDIKFKTPLLQHKLSHPTITTIIQDKRGYVWVGTREGLNQYDGYKNQIFRPPLISNSYINKLLIDNTERLWVATNAGLNMYDSKLNTFNTFKTSQKAPDFYSNLEVFEIFEDSQDRLWIGTRQNGILRIDKNRESTLFTKVIGDDVETLSLYPTSFVEVDNNIYVATNLGLLIYNKTNNTFEEILDTTSDIRKQLSKNINQLLSINNKEIFVGTNEGAYIFNIQKNEIKMIHPTELKNKIISELSLINDDEIFIGTRKSGVYTLKLASNRLNKYTNSPNQSNSIIDNQILSIYSNKNFIWVGTNTGLNIINHSQRKYNHLHTSISPKDCISGNTIYGLLIDSTRHLWFGSFGHGLHRIDLNTGSCDRIVDFDDTTPSDTFINITALYEDSESNIWIGTLHSGTYKYIRSANKFTKIQDDSISPSLVSSFKEDFHNNIWISSYSKGLYKYDKKQRLLTKELTNNGSNKFSKLEDINNILIKNNNLWIATAENGLWKIQLNTNKAYKVEKFQIPKIVTSIYFDKEKFLWLGTQEHGAIKYSLSENKSSPYSMKNGLLSNSVLNIVEDGSNNLWFFTEKGLSKLDIKKDKIYTFLEEDGLQADAFTPAGFYDKESNTIWTGGINGINWFNPDEISTTDEIPQVVLTDFELFYKPVELSNEKIKTPLDKVIGHTKKLNLNYTENVFAFTFSAMRFLHAEKIKYQFMLEGYDKEWNQVSADRRYANYTNIAPGNYIFKVKASNRFGEWGESETRLPIYIASPWWQTPYAYVSYVLLGLLSIYFITYYRTRLLIKRSEVLENQVKTRTEELSQEKSKVERLLDKKNEEFANVSHEFRTPLTLILGPLKKLLLKSNSQEDSKRLETIQKNGFRLLRMVDQLLHLETFKLKSITQQRPIAMGKIIQVLTEAFKDVAKEKNIVIQQNKTLDVTFRFTPDAIEKITLNLLSNAIKYTPPRGLVTVITERTDNNELKLSVSDTGIGIPHNKLDSVFERYSRVLDKNSEKVTGAGIGLALVKELVETHSGHINISSELNQGTTIEIYLPIIDEVTALAEELYLNDEAISMEVMNISSHNQTQNISSHESTLSKNNNASTELIADSFNSHIKTILIIEDHADMRDYIQESISQEFNFLLAKNGVDGLKQAQEYIPDLIISDIMMPEMDGYEVTRTLRSQDTTNHIPIILLTARGDRESRLKGWHEQADEYLTKPFDDEELNIRINNLLSIRNILKKRFGQEIFTSHLQTEESPASKNEAQDLDTQYSIQQKEFIEKLNLAISELYQEPTLSIATIAKNVAMSERQFFRKLKSILDMSPTEYLRRYRLEKATYLLKQGKSASFTAFEVGFSSQSYFGKCFKAQFDISPAQYQKDFSD